MDFLFAKELTNVGFKAALKSPIFCNRVIFCNKIFFWSKIMVANISLILSSKGFILSSKVNKVDFKGSKGFLENIIVISSKSKLKVIKNEFNRIW